MTKDPRATMAESDRKRWDDRYREAGERQDAPSPFLTALDGLLPRSGRALDAAGGTGRHALWLARCGLEVTLTDISEVALQRARAGAAAEHLSLRTFALDLETEPFPAGPWDLILCVRFLWRPLFKAFAESLAPGGMLIVAHPTRSNLQRHARPSLTHLLDDGELPSLVPGLTIISYEEGWHDGFHEAHLVARARLSGRGAL